MPRQVPTAASENTFPRSGISPLNDGNSSKHEEVFKGVLGVPLKEIYLVALSGKNAEDRAMAFRLANACIENGMRQVEASADYIRTSNDGRVIDVQEVRRRSNAAALRLKAYCDGGDSEKFIESVRGMSGQRIGFIDKNVKGTGSKDFVGEQARFQALTQMLSNPRLYPAQFDGWLESVEFSRIASRYGLSHFQVRLAADELVNRFGLGGDMAEFRQLRSCGNAYLCAFSGEVDSAELSRAYAAVDAIEKLIRTQQWDPLTQMQ